MTTRRLETLSYRKKVETVDYRRLSLQLEIWGKAQRESARRPKSDWGKLGVGVKFSRHQSHVGRTQMHWYTPNAHCRLSVGQH